MNEEECFLDTVNIPLIAKGFEKICNLQFEDVSEFRRCCQYNFSENEKMGRNLQIFGQ